MGRLPTTWANRVITQRFPYEFSGEKTVTTAATPSQYPDATFQNTCDKPFEIHRMIPRLYALDSQGVLLTSQPTQELLMGLVRVSINDLGLDQIITKRPTLIGTLVKGEAELTWEFADPHTMERSNQLQVTLEGLVFPAITNLVSIRVALVFQGFLLILAPPSENR